MAKVEPIHSNDFDALYEKSLREDDARNNWQRLFEPYSNRCEVTDFGYMLVDGSEIIGAPSPTSHRDFLKLQMNS